VSVVAVVSQFASSALGQAVGPSLSQLRFVFHAEGLTAICRWLSASDTTGLRPTWTSTPDGVPAGDLIRRREAAIPAEMVFCGGFSGGGASLTTG